MIIFLNADAELVYCDTDRLRQGSNRASKITLVAPFVPSSVVSLAFSLPNGITLGPTITDNTEGVSYTMAGPVEIPGYTVDGAELYTWSYTVNSAITSSAGTLGIQFFISGTDDTLASDRINIPVYNGVRNIDTSNLSPDLWQDVLETLVDVNASIESLNESKLNALERSGTDYAFYGYPGAEGSETYGNDTSAETLIKGTSKADANTVAVRDANGRTKVAVPQADDDAVNLAYLTNNFLRRDANRPYEQVADGLTVIDLTAEGLAYFDGDIDAFGDAIFNKSVSVNTLNVEKTDGVENEPEPSLNVEGQTTLKNVIAEAVTARSLDVDELNVTGTATIVNQQSLLIKDHVIVANSDNGTLGSSYSGMVILIGQRDEETGNPLGYGIMYQKSSDTVNIGLGVLSEYSDGSKRFVFKSDEAQPLATRPQNMYDGFIPIWDNEIHSFKNGINLEEVLRANHNSSTHQRVYGVTLSGEQIMFTISAGTVSNALVVRTGDGNIILPESTNTGSSMSPRFAVSQKYLNDRIAELQAQIEALKASAS